MAATQKNIRPPVIRTHHCGELSQKDLQKSVTLAGWVSKRRDHGGLIFLDLRDRYGITQIVFDPALQSSEAAHKLATEVRAEFVIQCKGTVRSRPEGMRNKRLPTGEIEVASLELKILSRSKTPPFEVKDGIEITENLRFKYRYLDLRRPQLQRNLKIRHQALQAVRHFLNQNQFLEIETPILYKSTPEGARDFIVPSRMTPGHFYALPQSPQTLKQLLMIGGMDRYYQIARCFRDEDLRADRQPEFSQIDIELSFVTEEQIRSLLEEMMAFVWKEVLGVTLTLPFPVLEYREALERFGSDKPDTRFGLELVDLSSLFEKSTFQVFQKALLKNDFGERGSIRGLPVPGGAEKFSRKDLDALQKLAQKHGAKGLLWIKVQSKGELQSPAAKFFSEEEKKALVQTQKLKEGDLVLSVSDPKNAVACEALGAVRLAVGEKLGLIPELGSTPDHFLWVNRFPLLEYSEADGRFYAKHHPFTQPHPDHVSDFLEGKNLHLIQAAAYDLVLNGAEAAGGSLRIYDSEMQKAMFRTLQIDEKEAQKQFGFFLEALQYGTPPHGGIAFGVERLTAMLCRVGPIRDTMAFPKTQRGQCLMSGSPSVVSPDQLAELGMSVVKRKSQ